MFNVLSNSQRNRFPNRITRSHGGMGGGFGGGGGGQIIADEDEVGDDDIFADDGDSGSQQQQQNPPAGEQDEKAGTGDFSVEQSGTLGDFWEGFGETSPDMTPEEFAAQIQAEEKRVSEELMAGFNNFALPQDLIPEDFDVNNPQQLSSVMQRAVGHGVQQAVRLMMTPMQAALKTNQTATKRFVAQQQQSGFSQQGWESEVSRYFPAINDPDTGPVIRTVVQQARKNNPGNKPAEIQAGIQAISKALSVLGVSGKSKRAASQARSSNTLDSFMPIRETKDRLRG